MTIDLTEVRALAAAARADTSDGLEAREKLPGIVEALVAEIETMLDPGTPQELEWTTRVRFPGGTEGMSGDGCDVGERLARLRVTNWPHIHAALLRRTVTYGPWVEVPAGAEASDG